MSDKWCLIIRGIECNEAELELAQDRIRDVFGLPAAGTITVHEYVYEHQTRLALGQRSRSRVGSRTNLPGKCARSVNTPGGGRKFNGNARRDPSATPVSPRSKKSR